MAIVTSHSRSVRATSGEAPRWQQAMKAAIRDPRELCQTLELPGAYEDAAVRAAIGFPLFAPPGYVAKIERGNPHDPLLRQVLPLAEELDDHMEFIRDPVGDLAATVQPGLLHKYHGRALLVMTGACAIHCRYCFRRHFPYSESPSSIAAWRPAIEQIAQDDSIEEIILSGGDPLTLADSILQRLVDELRSIPHLRRLRIHTRLPIVIPERVTGGLIELLKCSSLTPLLVVHANHPRELGPDVSAALMQVVDAGIPTLNQAVLLRGVNDEVETLVNLSRRLVDQRIIPYYLHQLDRVAGAAHFEVPVQRGRELMAEVQRLLPGYAVPRYVQDDGGPAKQILV